MLSYSDSKKKEQEVVDAKIADLSKRIQDAVFALDAHASYEADKNRMNPRGHFTVGPAATKVEIVFIEERAGDTWHRYSNGNVRITVGEYSHWRLFRDRKKGHDVAAIAHEVFTQADGQRERAITEEASRKTHATLEDIARRINESCGVKYEESWKGHTIPVSFPHVAVVKNALHLEFGSLPLTEAQAIILMNACVGLGMVKDPASID